MSVVGIALELGNSPQASFNEGKHTITRWFSVQTTNALLDGPIQVANAIGIPRMHQSYVFGTEFHPYCRVRDIIPHKPADGSLVWHVEVVYETPDQKQGAMGDGGNSSGVNQGTGVENDQEWENPLAAIPEIETRMESEDQPIYGVQGMGCPCTTFNNANHVNCNATAFFNVGDNVRVSYKNKTLTTTVTSITAGLQIGLAANWPGLSSPNNAATIQDLNIQPIRSSAGEIFIPSPTFKQSTLILTITGNYDLSYPAVATSLLYADAVNSDVFWGANPYQCKVTSITWQRQSRPLPDGTQFPYLRVSYDFHFRNTWALQILDKGTYYKVPKTGGGQLTLRFMTDDNNPCEGLLDGQGGKLADGLNPVFLNVFPYNALPFSALNLPQAFSQVS